eukprot:gene12906-27225_t
MDDMEATQLPLREPSTTTRPHRAQKPMGFYTENGSE